MANMSLWCEAWFDVSMGSRKSQSNKKDTAADNDRCGHGISHKRLIKNHNASAKMSLQGDLLL